MIWPLLNKIPKMTAVGTNAMQRFVQQMSLFSPTNAQLTVYSPSGRKKIPFLCPLHGSLVWGNLYHQLDPPRVLQKDKNTDLGSAQKQQTSLQRLSVRELKKRCWWVKSQQQSTVCAGQTSTYNYTHFKFAQGKKTTRKDRSRAMSRI